MPEQFPRTQDAIRLTAGDLRILLLWLLAAIAGIVAAQRYFFQAFPEAAVDFKVSREQALERARDFVRQQGGSPDGYESAIVFSVDEDEKTYLERELGLEQANRLMASEVSVWYWDARFFKPLQKEEFRVGIDPGGRVVRYRHVLEEAAPGARLGREAALARAEHFLREQLHAALGAYTFLPAEANSSERPNRRDWSFTWERSGFRAKDAPYRLRVNLAGEQASGYQESLQAPEAWQREFERMRSRNNLIAAAATIGYAVLLGAALAAAFGLGRRGLAPWGWALRFGLVIAALYFGMQANQWPLARSEYETNGSYSSFILSQAGLWAGTSILLALLVVVALVPGEPWYRATFPEKLRLGALNRWAAWRSKEFFVSGTIGLCLAAAHIGYVVLFYVAGRRFGVWAPQDLQYSDTLSTALPWIYPLTIGIYAATSEEFLFRLFAVPWLKRLTKSTALAVVLPALAWGFLHANYPQEPPYIRGIEVGAIGIVAGLVMLRWGIVATLTWHYSVDAFLSGLSLMRSADWYSRISGTVVGLGALIPVAIAGIVYVWRGSFAEAAPLVNGAAPLGQALPAEEERTAKVVKAKAVYRPLSRRAIGGLGACAAAALAVALAAKAPQIGDFVRFSIDAGQAQARSDAALRQRGIEPSGFRRAATIQYRMDPQVNEYLRRSIGVQGANRLYQSQVPAAFWTVRYFRDSQKEEYLVVLREDGRLHSIHHTLPEAAPGANLSKEQAQQLAETYLERTQGIDLREWRLVDANSDKLPARTDHDFTWEQKKAAAWLGGDEGAHVRMELRVQGNEPTAYRVFLHLPEQWLRKQNQETLAITAHRNGLLALAGAFGVAVLIVFVKNLKQPAAAEVPWRRFAKWAAAGWAAFAGWIFTNLPQYLARYPTENSFATYAGMALISFVLFSAAVYASLFVLFGLAWFLLQKAHGGSELPGWRAMPAEYYRDAAVIGVCGCAAGMGMERAWELVARLWPVARYELAADVPSSLDAALPAVQVAAASLLQSLAAAGALGLIAGFMALYLREKWKQAAMLGLTALLMAPRWGSTGDLLQHLAAGWVTLLLVWWAVRRVARFNLLGYFLAGALLLAAAGAGQLLRQPNGYFQANGAALIVACAGLAAWPVVEWRRGLRAERRGAKVLAQA